MVVLSIDTVSGGLEQSTRECRETRKTECAKDKVDTERKRQTDPFRRGTVTTAASRENSPRGATHGYRGLDSSLPTRPPSVLEEGPRPSSSIRPFVCEVRRVIVLESLITELTTKCKGTSKDIYYYVIFLYLLSFVLCCI